MFSKTRVTEPGPRNQSAPEPEAPRSYEVPGYTVWSARVAYQLSPEVNLALNANNLFDKKYWVAGFNQLNGSNNYGEPRNLMFSVKYTPQF